MFKILIKGYCYDTAHDVLLSVFPSVKYQIAGAVTLLSTWLGIWALLLGMSTATLAAFVVAAIAELASGIWASVIVRKDPFVSGKLGRWAFKFVFLLIGLYLLHAFKAALDPDSYGASCFSWAYDALFIQGAAEYVISITENYATITGRDKTYFITALRTRVDAFLNGNN